MTIEIVNQDTVGKVHKWVYYSCRCAGCKRSLQNDGRMELREWLREYYKDLKSWGWKKHNDRWYCPECIGEDM